MLNYKECLRYNLRMKINDEITSKIEKMANTGCSIVRVDGFVIFVNDGCPDDIAIIKVTKVNKNYAIGEIIEIITPSKYRVKPFCPMQKVCGACQFQHIDYDYQLKIKKQITEETIKSISGLDIPIFDTIKSPEIQHYRHKIQYPVSETKNSHRMIAGYYKPKSHELVNIKYCPIQPEICDEIIDFIRQEAQRYNISGYKEKTHAGLLRHILIRNSTINNENLVVLVINENKISNNINQLAQAIYDKFPDVCGVCVNFNTRRTNVILGNTTKLVVGKDYIIEKILDKNFKIGAKTFFQVNPKSAENIFNYVKNYIAENFNKPIVLDAYAGITSFGICISDICEKVVSVEENKDSCELAKEVVKDNNISNVEINNMDAAEFFAKEKREFDVVILDPPRKGCSTESLDEAYKLSKNSIIYVSCNPATLARDLKYLNNKGCEIVSIQPFDMFCHTYHIENVAIIRKK